MEYIFELWKNVYKVRCVAQDIIKWISYGFNMSVMIQDGMFLKTPNISCIR